MNAVVALSSFRKKFAHTVAVTDHEEGLLKQRKNSCNTFKHTSFLFRNEEGSVKDLFLSGRTLSIFLDPSFEHGMFQQACSRGGNFHLPAKQALKPLRWKKRKGISFFQISYLS